MTTLEQYLKDHKIDPFSLSVEAGVRYVTVWNAVKEKPIFYANAQKIRGTLRRLTGMAYTGPFPTIDEPPVERWPNMRMEKMRKNNNDVHGCHG